MSARAIEAIFDEEPVPYVLTELGDWVTGTEWIETVEASEILRMPRGSIGDLALRGHIVGRKVGHCWLLELESVELYARDRRGRMGRPPGSRRRVRTPAIEYVPAEPLLRLIASRGGPRACGIAQGSAEERALDRARRSGRLTDRAADQLCVRVLGLTPWEVWGEEAAAE